MNYILWNPDDTIIDLGFYALRWYSILFALGFVFSYLILKRQFKKEKVEEDKLERLTIYIVLATVIGARLGHCLFYDFDYYSQHILEIFLPFTFEPSFEFIGYQGLASHGGALGILIALVLYSRKYKMNILWVADKLALVMPLAFGLIRLGNLMNSEILGSSATVPWAFVFLKVDDIPRHPAQLYEAIAYLLTFLLLTILNRRVSKPAGFLFGIFLIMVASARFILEFFKEDQAAFEEGMLLNMGQLLSLPFILLGLILVLLPKKATKADN